MKPRVEKTARRNRRPTEREFHTEVTKDTEALVIPSDCRAGAPPARFLGSATPKAFACSRFFVGAGAVALQIILLAALSPSAIAQATLTSPGLCSIDGFDCITSYETDEEPLHVCNSSDPWNGQGETASITDDKAVIPPRYDQDHPLFPGVRFDELTLRLLGIPSFWQPQRSPYHYCLRANLRERAPPSLA